MKIATTHLSLDENSEIITKSIQLQFTRVLAAKMATEKPIGKILVIKPSPCGIFVDSHIELCEDTAITEKVSNFN